MKSILLSKKGLLVWQLIVSFLLVIGLKFQANANERLEVMNAEFGQELSDLESQINAEVVYQKNTPIVVKASPLEEEQSPQEKMRKQRIAVEKETEKKVFTKIEADRLKAEAQLRKKIMNRLDNQLDDKAQESPSQAAVNTQPPIVIQAPSPLETVNKDTKSSDHPFYIGAGIGMNMFPSTYNIKPGITASGVLGARFKDVWLAEAGGSYSLFRISNPYSPGYGDNHVEEFAISLGVKRQLGTGVFRPVLGFSGVYRFRNHRDEYDIFSQFNTVKSQGLDMGVSGGLDFVLSPQLIIGTEIRYMMNLTNSLPMEAYYAHFHGYKLSDELKYVTFGINTKLFF